MAPTGRPVDLEAAAGPPCHLLEKDTLLEKIAQLDTTCWMARLDDHRPVSALTIPGTHDSAAYRSQWPFVKTQNMDIAQQLDAGIRYFDLRCGLTNDVLQIVHGRVMLGTSLAQVVQTMYDFLAAHSSEGLLAQIKQDRDDQNSTLSFGAAVDEVMDSEPSRWRIEPTTPTMASLRGKIQLLRRFRDMTDSMVPSRDQGIDLTCWLNNPAKPFVIPTPHTADFTIQDHFKPDYPEPLPELIELKGGDVSNLLRLAAADPDPAKWYLNFTSAFEINLVYQLTPVQVALGSRWNFGFVTGINARLAAWLERTDTRTARYGVVLMDFPDAEPAAGLVSALVACNDLRLHHSTSMRPDWVRAVVSAILWLVLLAGVVLRLVCGPVGSAGVLF